MQIDIKRTISGKPEFIFRQLTEQLFLQKWFTPDVIAFPKKGTTAAFAFEPDKHLKVEIIELVENETVKWKCIDGNINWEGSIISFRLRKINENKTELVFSQTGLTETDKIENWKKSWSIILTQLQQLNR